MDPACEDAHDGEEKHLDGRLERQEGDGSLNSVEGRLGENGTEDSAGGVEEHRQGDFGARRGSGRLWLVRHGDDDGY